MRASSVEARAVRAAGMLPLSANAYRVLLIEDNPGDVELARELMADTPCLVLNLEVAGTLAQACALLRKHAAEAVILDLGLPDSQGIDTLRAVRAVAGEAPIIVLSGHSDEALRQQALSEGAEEVITKREANSRLFCRCVLYEIERNRARAQHRRLEGMLDAMPDGILVVNQEGQTQFVNQAALQLFGQTREELARESLLFSVADGEPLEIVIQRPGEARTCEMRVAALEWDGEPAHLASIRDITLRRQAEALRVRSAELELQNDRISKASRLKSEFLANVSHEIRTPMNAIIGLGYLLGQTSLDSEQSGLLAQLHVASRSLMGLISDVLDLSKIEAGEVVLEDVPFQLQELLRELEQMIEPLTRNKPVELRLHTVGEVPRQLRGDITRIRQILINLLGNAIKFTESGVVRLCVCCGEAMDGRVGVEFVVSDTGIGMSTEVLARIFAPFTQADTSTTRRFGGSGLGLSIVRQLVELMGGEVHVSSRPGEGSEFRVHLPLALASVADEAGESACLALEVLVLEPPRRGQAAVTGWARTLGWRSHAVTSAAELHIRLNEALRRGRPPDAVLIEPGSQDWQGLRTLAELKKGLDARRLPPFVLVLPDVRLPLGDSGLGGLADALVGRPAGAAALFNAVNAALIGRGACRQRLIELTRLEAAGALTLPGVHVLVADDCSINRDVARRILEREGASVTVCASGRDAVLQLQRGAPVDVVLMDIQMPELDGCSATRAMREELGLRDLPILALTAGALQHERQRALEAGMDEFIPKPLNPLALIRAVRRHAERARGAPLALVPRPSAADPGLPAWPYIEGIDGREVAQRLGGDVSLFTAMLDNLLREAADLADLPDTGGGSAGNTEDRERLARRMHRLRGSAAVLAAHRLQRAAGEAEQALRPDRGSEGLQQVLGGVAAALVDLDRHAHGWIQAHAATRRRSVSDAAEPQAAADIPELQSLLQLLRSQDLAAGAQLAQRGGALESALGVEEVGRLREAVQRLDYSAAAARLEALVAAESAPG